MLAEKSSQQKTKSIIDATNILAQWSIVHTKKLLSFQTQDNNGILDIDKLKFDSQTFIGQQQKKQSFFSTIPNCFIDQQTFQRISNFKCNYVSSKRKEELFKRQKKQQQEKIYLRKKQMQRYYSYKQDIQRGFKGQFTLKRGQQVHTCSITSDDLQKLRPQTDLNDVIIANYLKYIQTQLISEQTQKNVFIYSSFFIQKLLVQMIKQQPPMNMNQKQQRGYSQIIRGKVIQNYKNIKRWTRRVDIFEKQYLVIPINAYKHWYCVMVANPGSLIQMNKQKQPYIVYCDSMFEKRFYINDAIRMYLEIQIEDKKSQKIKITEDNLPCYQLLLPRQTNLHDCGLYMLAYIQHLLINKHQLQVLQDVKNRQKLTIFPRSLIYSMRQRLKDLFIKLIQNPDELNRKQILIKYKQDTDRIIKQADDEKDIDTINIKQFKKYQSINSHLLENVNGYQLTQEELQFACKIKFYLDPQVNFYQRDRLF